MSRNNSEKGTLYVGKTTYAEALLYGKARCCVKGSASTIAEASGVPIGVEVDEAGA